MKAQGLPVLASCGTAEVAFGGTEGWPPMQKLRLSGSKDGGLVYADLETGLKTEIPVENFKRTERILDTTQGVRGLGLDLPCRKSKGKGGTLCTESTIAWYSQALSVWCWD